MYNLDEIVKTYFSSVSGWWILNETVSYNKFPQQQFMILSRDFFYHYSDTEVAQLYCYSEKESQEGGLFAGTEGRSRLNVFAALEELAEQLLTTENNPPVCIYKHLLRFRSVTQQVEEDLLVCAYLAMRHKR